MNDNEPKQGLIYVDGTLFGMPLGLLPKSDNIKMAQTKTAWDKAQKCADMFNELAQSCKSNNV